MNKFKLLPSLLFTPGTKPESFFKAYEMGAGGVILDLEDSVSPADKKRARKNISKYFDSQPKFTRPFANIIRINALSSLEGLQDLLFLTESKIPCDGIYIPKLVSHYELHLFEQWINEAGMDIPLLAQIETQQAIRSVEEIASLNSKVQALCFGAADYCVSLGTIPLNWDSLLYARMRMVVAAGISKIGLYDSPFFNIPDIQGLKEETKRVKDLGFTGKLAIHPSHLAHINQIFTPSEQEYDNASNIIAAFEKSKGNACQFNGQMIDVPIYESAKNTVGRFKLLKEL